MNSISRYFGMGQSVSSTRRSIWSPVMRHSLHQRQYLVAVHRGHIQRLDILGLHLVADIFQGIEIALERTEQFGDLAKQIGVGLHPGYKAAQRLYSRLGYLLDRQGVYYGHRPVEMGEVVTFNDNLVIYFTKELE